MASREVEGYRVELPDEHPTASFGPDSVLNPTPELVGPIVSGTAMAERAQVTQVQLAADGGNHPQAEANEHATQLAASGLDYVRRSHCYA